MKKNFLPIFVILILSCSPVLAKPYTYKIIRIIDGDTLEIDGPPLPKELKLSVRVLGIDTPEKGSRAKCKKESDLGKKSFKFTVDFVGFSGREAVFSNIKWDKFGGRILADVEIDGVSLAKSLLKAGLAREYFGKKKKSWCD
jgi:endonuclease YncB( thermonuclease family)